MHYKQRYYVHGRKTTPEDCLHCTFEYPFNYAVADAVMANLISCFSDHNRKMPIG